MSKKIGIIGGLSPESTVTYYLHITRRYVEIHGDYGYPEILIYSVNLENYHLWRNQNRWDLITDDLVKAGRVLEAGGAEIGCIATNTMHKVFDEVQAQLKMPLVHILDAVIPEIQAKSIHTVGLLGTRFTMSERFYADRLRRNGVEVLVPDSEDQELIHRVIEDELVRGVLRDESRVKYQQIIARLAARGAEGIVLGCTEIPLLIKAEDSPVPVFDTAVIHAEAMLVGSE
jgi:aspartate racemase